MAGSNASGQDVFLPPPFFLFPFDAESEESGGALQSALNRLPVSLFAPEAIQSSTSEISAEGKQNAGPVSVARASAPPLPRVCFVKEKRHTRRPRDASIQTDMSYDSGYRTAACQDSIPEPQWPTIAQDSTSAQGWYERDSGSYGVPCRCRKASQTANELWYDDTPRSYDLQSAIQALSLRNLVLQNAVLTEAYRTYATPGTYPMMPRPPPMPMPPSPYSYYFYPNYPIYPPYDVWCTACQTADYQRGYDGYDGQYDIEEYGDQEEADERTSEDLQPLEEVDDDVVEMHSRIRQDRRVEEARSAHGAEDTEENLDRFGNKKEVQDGEFCHFCGGKFSVFSTGLEESAEITGVREEKGDSEFIKIPSGKQTTDIRTAAKPMDQAVTDSGKTTTLKDEVTAAAAGVTGTGAEVQTGADAVRRMYANADAPAGGVGLDAHADGTAAALTGIDAEVEAAAAFTRMKTSLSGTASPVAGIGAGADRTAAAVVGIGAEVDAAKAVLASMRTGLSGTASPVTETGPSADRTAATVTGIAAEVDAAKALLARTKTGLSGTGSPVMGAGAGADSTGAEVTGIGAEVDAAKAVLARTKTGLSGTGSPVTRDSAGEEPTAAAVIGICAEVDAAKAILARTKTGLSGPASPVAGVGAGADRTAGAVTGICAEADAAKPALGNMKTSPSATAPPVKQAGANCTAAAVTGIEANADVAKAALAVMKTGLNGTGSSTTGFGAGQDSTAPTVTGTGRDVDATAPPSAGMKAGQSEIASPGRGTGVDHVATAAAISSEVQALGAALESMNTGLSGSASPAKGMSPDSGSPAGGSVNAQPGSPQAVVDAERQEGTQEFQLQTGVNKTTDDQLRGGNNIASEELGTGGCQEETDHVVANKHHGSEGAGTHDDGEEIVPAEPDGYGDGQTGSRPEQADGQQDSEKGSGSTGTTTTDSAVAYRGHIHFGIIAAAVIVGVAILVLIIILLGRGGGTNEVQKATTEFGDDNDNVTVLEMLVQDPTDDIYLLDV